MIWKAAYEFLDSAERELFRIRQSITKPNR